MSDVIISGTLILNGNLTCDENITVTPTGLIVPIPSSDFMKSIYSCQSGRYVYYVGKGRLVETLYGSINIEGTINGSNLGFGPNQGPGCNSVLFDNLHHVITGYGATHAGTGGMTPDPGTIQYYTEEFTVTGLEEDQRYLLLTGIPIDSNVAVNPLHGPAQYYPDDFSLDANALSWIGKPLESVIIVGEELRVLYTGSTQQIVPPPKDPYGSYESPVSLGSGSNKTSGGGSIHLEADSGTVTINGNIFMNGEGGSPSVLTGGGSGGSVWVTSWAIDGTGLIEAQGGSKGNEYSGGGGGGYVSLKYERSYDFRGSVSVVGMDGGSEGIYHIDQVKPAFEEKFTGRIWNTKWWETISESVTLNNLVLFDSSSDDTRTPAIQSLFSISGDMKLDIDYLPRLPEASWYSNYFLLYKDELNWVGVTKKQGCVFGVYSVDGVQSQTGILTDNTDMTFRLLKQDSTFTFQYYDSTDIPVTMLVDTIPEFADEKFKIRVGVDKMETTDATALIVEELAPTSYDLSNKYITLSGLPVDSSSVTFNVNQGPSQYFGIDYYTDGRKVKWDLFGIMHADTSDGSPLFPVGEFVIEAFGIDSSVLADKYVTLSSHPYPYDNVAVSVESGPPQMYGTDFYVYQNKVLWGGKNLETLLMVDDTMLVSYWGMPTYIPPPLEDSLTRDDILRFIYTIDMTSNAVFAGFDNFKLFKGTLFNVETKDPVLYVDPVNGSDSSTGQSLDPLQNLFVATAWSKRGGTVVLYDGTHHPTEIVHKNLTIRGAEGALPIITTLDSLDTTGSNWETNCLTFIEGQGRMQNLRFAGAVRGVYAQATDNIEIFKCTATDVTTGLAFLNVPTAGAIIRGSKIYGTTVGVDFSGCYDPQVNSCLIYDNDIGILASDTSNLMVTASTIDADSTAVIFDGTCSGIVVSNNLTDCDLGISIAVGSSPVSVVSNNFADTGTQYAGKMPDVDTSNFFIEPLYVDQIGRDYHLTALSPDRGMGDIGYDRFRKDYDGVNRALSIPPEVGAYTYLAGVHIGDYYVSGGIWDDSTNFGGPGDPFRTLDRAGDGTVHIAAGNYDSFYLGLHDSSIMLDGSTSTFRSHFSNIDITRVVYVSPGGSDASGDGSKNNPYRTISCADSSSNPGDYILAMSGEYPEFTSITGRTLVFQSDPSFIVDRTTGSIFEDHFDQPDLRAWGHSEYDIQWDLTGNASIADGALRMIYDGVDEARADSIFTFQKDFEVSATIRNSMDPVFFSIHNPDTTATFQYNDGYYRLDVSAVDGASFCEGQLSIMPAEDKDFYTDYLCLTSDDTRLGWAALSFQAYDTSSSAVNLLGGVSQSYGVDYILDGARLIWGEPSLDATFARALEPGDNIRVIYKAQDLSEPVRVALSLKAGRLTARVSDGQSWLTVARRDMTSANLDEAWAVSFYMDETGSGTRLFSNGTGLVSKFQLIASDIEGTEYARELLQRTERKTVIIYRDRT